MLKSLTKWLCVCFSKHQSMCICVSNYPPSFFLGYRNIVNGSIELAQVLYCIIIIDSAIAWCVILQPCSFFFKEVRILQWSVNNGLMLVSELQNVRSSCRPANKPVSFLYFFHSIWNPYGHDTTEKYEWDKLSDILKCKSNILRGATELLQEALASGGGETNLSSGK